MAHKVLNTTYTNPPSTASRKAVMAPKFDSILTSSKPDNTAIYIDTCYLLGIVKSGRSLTATLEHLSSKATVIIMSTILEEFERNLYKRSELDQGRRSHILAEIKMLTALSQSNPNLLIEDVNVTTEELTSMRDGMRKVSSYGNSRVGIGEAAIVVHVRAVKEMFNRIFILSDDSDVTMLTGQLANVSVLAGIE